MISSFDGRIAISSSSTSEMWLFDFNNCKMLSTLLKQLRHTGTGINVDMLPVRSNCALIICKSTSTSCAGHFDRVEIYLNCSTTRVLSTPFFPRDMAISLSFESIISNVTSSLGIFMISCIDFSAGSNGIFSFVSSIVSDVVSLSEASPVFRKSSAAATSAGSIARMCFLTL